MMGSELVCSSMLQKAGSGVKGKSVAAVKSKIFTAEDAEFAEGNQAVGIS
jgi:hypothetical protein